MKAILCTIAVLIVVHFGLLEYRMHNYVVDAYANNVAPLSDTVRSLAEENFFLDSKVNRARQLVNSLVDENHRLKVALKESVERLQAEMDKNNTLLDKISNLNWKIEVLRSALEKVNEIQSTE